MKKLFLTLIALVATSAACFAQITLKDAYEGLADLPGMKAKTVQSVNVDGNAAISNVVSASAQASNASASQNFRDQFIYTIESLPIRNMLVGANNQREMATIFAEPAGNGQYNVLVLKANSLSGDYTASYGHASQATVDAIRNCQVSMDSDELVMTTTPAAGNAQFISMTK